MTFEMVRPAESRLMTPPKPFIARAPVHCPFAECAASMRSAIGSFGGDGGGSPVGGGSGGATITPGGCPFARLYRARPIAEKRQRYLIPVPVLKTTTRASGVIHPLARNSSTAAHSAPP